MNKLSFSIETDAPYSDEEMEQLKIDFIDFMSVDDDADKSTAQVSISDADDAAPVAKVTDEQKQEIIEEFLKNATFVASLNVSLDGDDMFHANLD